MEEAVKGCPKCGAPIERDVPHWSFGMAGTFSSCPNVDCDWCSDRRSHLPPGPFDLIYADPPWHFASNSTAKPGRNAMRHYPTTTVEETAAMGVRAVAARDAILLLWITVPFAHRAAEVIRAWGFRPKSQVVWIKSRIGTGYWARNRHELLHIATRGRFPCPKPALFPHSVIEGQQREHSRKPDAIFDTLDARLGHLRRLEMFARQQRRGWTAWGNQTTLFQEAAE